MDRLSVLEVERILEIVDHIIDVCRSDDEGITWGLEDELLEARSMLRKALKNG